MCNPSAPVVPRQLLTPRSSGAPTSCHAGRLAQGLRPILRQPPSAPHRWRQLSSNVRPRRQDLLLSKMQFLGIASARHQPRLLPRGARLLSPVWRQAASAILHRFVFGHLQRAKAALRHRSLRMAYYYYLHRICHQPCTLGLTRRSTGAPTAIVRFGPVSAGARLAFR